MGVHVMDKANKVILVVWNNVKSKESDNVNIYESLKKKIKAHIFWPVLRHFVDQ